ncbi:hypothetical protein [Shewanella sp. UCD-KL12]|nr:hypothetical protein [Shewanella sp. UCD-KL12]
MIKSLVTSIALMLFLHPLAYGKPLTTVGDKLNQHIQDYVEEENF